MCQVSVNPDPQHSPSTAPKKPPPLLPISFHRIQSSFVNVFQLVNETIESRLSKESLWLETIVNHVSKTDRSSHLSLAAPVELRSNSNRFTSKKKRKKISFRCDSCIVYRSTQRPWRNNWDAFKFKCRPTLLTSRAPATSPSTKATTSRWRAWRRASPALASSGGEKTATRSSSIRLAARRPPVHQPTITTSNCTSPDSSITTPTKTDRTADRRKRAAIHRNLRLPKRPLWSPPTEPFANDPKVKKIQYRQTNYYNL